MGHNPVCKIVLYIFHFHQSLISYIPLCSTLMLLLFTVIEKDTHTYTHTHTHKYIHYKLISPLDKSVTVYLIQSNMVTFINQGQRIEDNPEL